MPPRAYLEFCGRQPRDCQVSREMILSQSGTPGERDAATAAVNRPTSTVADSKSSLTPMISPASFSSKADTTEQGTGLPLPPKADAASTPLEQPQLPFASVRLEIPASAAAPQAAPLAAAGRGATLMMDSQTWSTINRANTKVNREIIRKPDLLNNGIEDRWSTPLEDGTKFGDCEDYVLEKRRALIAEGFPPSALSVAVVTTPWNTGHAVLLVAGDKGEYVLDNLSPWIVPWNEAPYTFRKRQVAGDAFNWVTVQPTGGLRSYAALNLAAL